MLFHSENFKFKDEKNICVHAEKVVMYEKDQQNDFLMIKTFVYISFGGGIYFWMDTLEIWNILL